MVETENHHRLSESKRDLNDNRSDAFRGAPSPNEFVISLPAALATVTVTVLPSPLETPRPTVNGPRPKFQFVLIRYKSLPDRLQARRNHDCDTCSSCDRMIVVSSSRTAVSSHLVHAPLAPNALWLVLLRLFFSGSCV